jgi:iron complex outermembrane receptor protein
MQLRLSPILMAAWAASIANFAAAQDSAPPAATQQVQVTGQALRKLDTRPSSTSRLGATLRETPATVNVVTKEEIDAAGALDTQEILKAIPGVVFSSQPGSPGSVFYRGFGSSSLSQLYNGISVQYDAIAARPVDSWIVDRLEAIGGPSSFLNGSGAVGGSINVITKIADTQGDSTHARAAVGDTRQVALSVQRGLGDGTSAHVLRADLNTTRGTHDAQGRDRKTWQAAASWRAPLATGLTHTLAAERQYERVDQPYWGTPVLLNDVGAVVGQIQIDPRTVGVNYNVVDGKYQQDVTWLRSITQWQDTQVAPTARFTHTLYHYAAFRDYENVEAYTFVNNNTQVSRASALLQRHKQRVSGSRGEFSLGADLAGMKSDFALGWDWSYNRQTRYPLSVAGPFDRTDPYDPTPTYFYQTPGITPGFVAGATNQLRTLALFAENRTVLAQGWALTSGLRVDRIELGVANHRAATASNPAWFETTFTPVTGRLGLVKDLSPAWQVYAQLSTAADPPSGLLATAGFSALRDFDLTKGRQVEVGSKASFDEGRGDASVSVYQIDRKNLSMTDPNDRTRVIPVGAQSSRGVEVRAQWQAARAFVLSGHLSYTDAQYDELYESSGTQTVSRAGNTPANVPAWVAGVVLSWQPAPTLGLAVDGRYVDKRYANTANTIYDDAYTLLGLGVTWRPYPGLTVRGRVNNVADTVYAASVSSNRAYLGAPRTVQLSADWQF